MEEKRKLCQASGKGNDIKGSEESNGTGIRGKQRKCVKEMLGKREKGNEKRDKEEIKFSTNIEAVEMGDERN